MAVVRWAYTIQVLHLGGKEAERLHADAISILDRLGREGWEAVSLSPSEASSHGLRVATTEYVVLMKRPMTVRDHRATSTA
jgi:hypothetical protein